MKLPNFENWSNGELSAEKVFENEVIFEENSAFDHEF